MSIINDALKKAQENKGLDKETIESPKRPSKNPDSVLKGTGEDKRFIFFIIFIIVAIGMIFVKIYPLAISRKMILNKPVVAPFTALPTPASPQPASLPTLNLNGIVYDDARPYAIINNKVLLEGDVIDGATLTEIRADRVKFIFEDKEFELSAK